MKMAYHLSPFGAAVQHQPVAPLPDSLFLCQPCGQDYRAPHEFLLLVSKICQGGDVGFGYDKNVFGCQRVDVPEGQEVIILMNDIAWYLAGNDAAKKAFLRHAQPPNTFGSPNPFTLVLPGDELVRGAILNRYLVFRQGYCGMPYANIGVQVIKPLPPLGPIPWLRGP